jgi:hypothetical protein
MDNYYINENGIWFGPMSENEFEARKRDKDKIVYWKPEFCVNRILHPQLCDHAKTWIKRTQIEKKPIESGKPTQPSDEPFKNQVIFHAEPVENNEELTESKTEKTKTEEKNQQPAQPTQEQMFEKEPKPVDQDKSNGFTFKLAIIIIGFILVFAAGFYVNSKLSVMFYQDIIIQESVKNIEYYTRDMMNETKEVKTDIDSLNAAMAREIKALKKQMKEMEAELIELKYRQ